MKTCTSLICKMSKGEAESPSYTYPSSHRAVPPRGSLTGFLVPPSRNSLDLYKHIQYDYTYHSTRYIYIFLTNGSMLGILFSTVLFSLDKIGYLGDYYTSVHRECPLILHNSFIILQHMNVPSFIT